MKKLLILLMLTFSGSVFANGLDISADTNSTVSFDKADSTNSGWTIKKFASDYDYDFEKNSSLWLGFDKAEEKTIHSSTLGSSGCKEWSWGSCFAGYSNFYVKEEAGTHSKINLDKQLFNDIWAPKFTDDVLNSWSDGNTGEGVSIGVFAYGDVYADKLQVYVPNAINKVTQYKEYWETHEYNWWGSNTWSYQGDTVKNSYSSMNVGKYYDGVTRAQIAKEIAGGSQYDEDGYMIGAGIAIDAAADLISNRVIDHDFVVGPLHLATSSSNYQHDTLGTVVIGRNTGNTKLHDDALTFIYVADGVNIVPEEYRDIAIAAPTQGGKDFRGHNQYHWLYGAARIAGSAALVKDKFDVSNETAVQILLDSASEFRSEVVSGNGFVDLEAALSLSGDIQ